VTNVKKILEIMYSYTFPVSVRSQEGSYETGTEATESSSL